MRKNVRLVMFGLAGFFLLLSLTISSWLFLFVALFARLGFAANRLVFYYAKLASEHGYIEKALNVYADFRPTGYKLGYNRHYQGSELIPRCLKTHIRYVSEDSKIVKVLCDAATQLMELKEGIRAAKDTSVSSSFISKVSIEADSAEKTLWKLSDRIVKANKLARRQKMDKDAFEKRVSKKCEEVQQLTNTVIGLRKYLSEMTVSTTIAGGSYEILSLAEEELRSLGYFAKEMADISL